MIKCDINGKNIFQRIMKNFKTYFDPKSNFDISVPSVEDRVSRKVVYKL